MEPKSEFVGLVRPQRFHQLRFSEQFILWAIRMWLRAYCRRSKQFAILHEAFDVLGISDAEKSFDNGMAIIAVGTRCDLLFLDVESQFVSQDEGDFLEMMAAYQTGNVVRAQARLDMWLPVSATRIAGTAFEEFAGILAGRGMPIGSQNGAYPGRAKRQNMATVIARLH